MERQESKFGKNTGIEDVEFRPRSYLGPTRQPADSSDFWVRAGVCFVVLIIAAVGLIEWNARRQAAAMTAELLRPMTPREGAQFKAGQEKAERELAANTAKEVAQLRRRILGRSAAGGSEAAVRW
ncbi:hypothetical protein [Xanthomonas oryzae]|uniref:Uncharacterized protein n=1 Tax=Xanthomonas oryzae pv. leersiae TaxID=3112258 RepID=A0AAJ6GYB0_9XANT|nr:hypothetical protein [Xanthomonas oryzae]WIX08439.1 hypothetical protein QN060_11155 [Xanthomonas oryzae pv. oryzae]